MSRGLDRTDRAVLQQLQRWDVVRKNHGLDAAKLAVCEQLIAAVVWYGSGARQNQFWHIPLASGLQGAQTPVPVHRLGGAQSFTFVQLILQPELSTLQL
jgi:hypothetical protein